MTWYAATTGWDGSSSQSVSSGFSFELERTGEVPAVSRVHRGVQGKGPGGLSPLAP